MWRYYQKVRDRLKDYVSCTQAGFIRGRSCGNNLWILRRVAERAIEFNVPVYCVLVDYKGAFDALNRTTLGRVLSLFLSPRMVRRIMCLYFDAKANVKINDITGTVFELFCGVRQGCPASPSFFTVTLSFVSWLFRSTFNGIKLMSIHLSCRWPDPIHAFLCWAPRNADLPYGHGFTIRFTTCTSEMRTYLFSSPNYSG